MSKQSKAFPILITIATPLIFYGVMHAGLQQNLGPLCELNENFASSGRPAYSQHCKCLGWKYFESPPPVRAPGSNAMRCFGIVRKSWTDTDDIALKQIEEKEKVSKSPRAFENLKPEVQDQIKATYKKLLQAAFRHDYPRTREMANAILLEVDDYGETKALESLAKKALEPASVSATETASEIATATATAVEPLPVVPGN